MTQTIAGVRMDKAQPYYVLGLSELTYNALLCEMNIYLASGANQPPRFFNEFNITRENQQNGFPSADLSKTPTHKPRPSKVSNDFINGRFARIFLLSKENHNPKDKDKKKNARAAKKQNLVRCVNTYPFQMKLCIKASATQ